jgi:hypothetical protein
VDGAGHHERVELVARRPGRPGQGPTGVNARALRGNGIVMLWSVVLIIAMMGVALPVSGWWLTRRMASAKPPYARAGRRLRRPATSSSGPRGAVDYPGIQRS